MRLLPSRWWIAVLLFCGTALSFFDRQVLSALAPEIRRDLGMSLAEYGDVASAFVLSYTVMFAVGGRFLDWVGTRLGMFACVAVWSVASAAHALVRAPAQLAAARFFLGIGEGGCFPGVTKAALEWFPSEERSRAIGFAIGGAAIGAVLAPPVAVWLVPHVGWRGAFLVSGVLGALWLAFWLVLYRVPAADDRGQEGSTGSPGNEETPPGKETPLPLGQLLRLPAVRGLMVTRFLLDPVMYLYMFWIPQYLSEARSASLADIGQLAWIPFLTLDIANMLGGFASDRLVRWGWTPRVARITVMGLAAAVTPVSIFSMYVERMDLAVLLMSVQMFAHGFWITNYITLTGDLVPQRSLGTVVGLCGCAGGISGYLTTRFIGRIVEQVTFVPVFIAAGVLYPIGFFVILATVQSFRRRETPAAPSP